MTVMEHLRASGLGSNAARRAMESGKVWVGGVPTAAVTELAATPGMKIKLIDHEEGVAGMNKIFGPLYVRDVIPPKTYPGQDQVNRIATVWNVLVARADMSDQVAYDIIKTIFERKATLTALLEIDAAGSDDDEPTSIQ